MSKKKSKKSLLIILVMSLFISIITTLFSFYQPEKPSETLKPVNDSSQLWTDCKLEGVIPLTLFNMAMAGYKQIENLNNKQIIVIIDYTKPSTQKRFYVINLIQKKLLYQTYVAHGKNSGDDYATRFSNLPGSLASCLGFFKTAETYMGENGYSLMLDGLEPGINSNARERSIVIHGADYVSDKYITKQGRLGRSWGCPALPIDLSKEIIDYIANGCCLFIYGNDDVYFKNSGFIRKEI
jgi:hypothetical protein